MSPTEETGEQHAFPPTAPVPTPVTESADETVHTVRLPGYSLAVRRSCAWDPALPQAVCVHGLGGSSLNWSAFLGETAATVAAEAVDLPGFGSSPPPDDGDYSVSGHARAVVRYLESTERPGGGPVHLVGNSLGGSVATRVAALRPDLVRTLTLISPALPEVPPQWSAVPTALLAVPGAAALFARFSRDWTPERRVGNVLALCYGDPARVDARAFGDAVEEQRERQELPYFWDALVRSTRGIVDAYTLGGQHSLWRQAERVLAPTLLVYGGRDQLVGFRMAHRAAARFRDARLLELPDAGHVAMMEYPMDVARAFRELVAEQARLTPTPGAREAAESTHVPPKGD